MRTAVSAPPAVAGVGSLGTCLVAGDARMAGCNARAAGSIACVASHAAENSCRVAQVGKSAAPGPGFGLLLIRRRTRIGNRRPAAFSASVTWRATARPGRRCPHPGRPAVAHGLPGLGRGHVRGRVADGQHRVTGLGTGAEILRVVPRLSQLVVCGPWRPGRRQEARIAGRTSGSRAAVLSCAAVSRQSWKPGARPVRP